MKKLMFVFGTRPEFIKVFPVIKEAQKRNCKITIVNTGQHKEMINQLLEFFSLDVDYDLKIMDKSKNLTEIVTKTMEGVDQLINKEHPDIVLVHGDTAATLGGSLAAFFNKVEVAHIEAGLRTFNKYSPFPEEINRQIVGNIADYNFAPTENSKQNLLNENKKEDSIFVVGNTAIDMLQYTIDDNYQNDIIVEDKKTILITIHRRENINLLEDIFSAINYIADKYLLDYNFLYPIHMNPQIRKIAKKELLSPNIKIVDPMDTIDFHNVMKKSHLVLTDSGGIQEEAPSLGKPVLVIRDTTERPEGVSAGTLKLIGTKKENIIKETINILENKEDYAKMSSINNPYGDGKTSQRILDILLKE